MASIKVIVSMKEEWELARYLEHYRATRRLAACESVSQALQAWLARYPSSPPYRKSDLDYFLDANYARAG